MVRGDEPTVLRVNGKGGLYIRLETQYEDMIVYEDCSTRNSSICTVSPHLTSLLLSLIWYTPSSLSHLSPSLDHSLAFQRYLFHSISKEHTSPLSIPSISIYTLRLYTTTTSYIAAHSQQRIPVGPASSKGTSCVGSVT